MTKIDEIVARAYKDLDRFYETHGEQVVSNIKRPTKRNQIVFNNATPEEAKILNELKKKKPPARCKHPGCKALPKPGNQFCNQHFILSPTKEGKDRGRPSKKLSLNIKGLNSREIVDLIKKETGEIITVSLKSKQNIIRHTKLILKKKGIRLYV
jgi:hypothetical protein